MKKSRLIVLTMIILSFCFVAGAFAMEKGNERKGKYTYRKVYEACHARGGINSPKPPLSPDAKTMAQWEEVFNKKAFDEFGCKDEWEKLSAQDMADIFAYLYGHAVDSPSPAKCN